MEKKEETKHNFFNKIGTIAKGELVRIKRLVSMFFEDNCTIWASAISLATLLAIVPLIAISFPIVSSFQIFADTKARVIELILKYIVPSTSSTLVDYVNKFVENSSGINLFGIMSFVLVSISLLISIEHSFNAVWKVKKSRPIASKLTVYWTAITITPILIGTSLYISTFLADFSGNSFVQYIYYLRGKVFPALLLWLAFFVLFKLMPHKDVKIVPALIGSFFAALFWGIAKRFFSYFIGHFANYEQIYGPISSAILFFLWIYVSWLIILFCCEISYDVQHQKELKQASMKKPKYEGNYREFFTLKVIQVLIEQFREGKGALTTSQIAKKLKAPLDIVEEIVVALQDKNIAEELGTKKNSYILSKNPEIISFGEAIFSLNKDLLLIPEQEDKTDKISKILKEARSKLEEVLGKNYFEKP